MVSALTILTQILDISGLFRIKQDKLSNIKCMGESFSPLLFAPFIPVQTQGLAYFHILHFMKFSIHKIGESFSPLLFLYFMNFLLILYIHPNNLYATYSQINFYYHFPLFCRYDARAVHLASSFGLDG